MPKIDRTKLKLNVKLPQFAEPLFEFSGACSGCGETPYIKLITQLYGDRSMIANATGCSSIFGGNLPATPWTKNLQGRGPAWANSLFEDNAEFGLGSRLALGKHVEQARKSLLEAKNSIGPELTDAILEAGQLTEADIQAQRDRVQSVKDKLGENAKGQLAELADYLVRKDVWKMGGDGWAYDIGSGGLDHIMASGKNVNLLVLDTEVYSNTGGQQSKATAIGAVAKFVSGGKLCRRKTWG